ncbi:MAG: SDR family NAD(P)-dependent oxidoreductase [Verrucomicrobiota bacterium]
MQVEVDREKYGPWAVVTGASSGIGKECARVLGKLGFHLFLVARNEDALNVLATELIQSHPITVEVFPLDFSHSGSNRELFEETSKSEVGLFVAASGFGTSGPFLSSPLDREQEMMRVNCAAVLEQCHHFGNRFRDRGSGGVILFGSIVGFQGTPLAAHYAATKAYIQSLAEGLRAEWKPHGVDILSSAPGPTETGFSIEADMKMNGAMSPRVVAEETLAALGRRSTVLPGFQTKFLSYSLAMLPRWGRVLVMKAVMSGMTKHQRTSA